MKKKYLEHLPLVDNANLPKIYFRSVDDVCTLSLDTTGERLHLRGEKILTGLAPIRENLAALLLIELRSHLKNEAYTLLDPMCGSGTFLIEANDSLNITRDRDFSFLHIPVVLDGLALLKVPESFHQQTYYKEFLGFEINSEVVKLAKINCAHTKIKIEIGDLFQGSSVSKPPMVVIINPPYGIRVGTRGNSEEEINLGFYLKIIEATKLKYSPELMGIIIPKDYALKSNKDFKIHSARAFKNGGIDVVFYVLGFK